MDIVRQIMGTKKGSKKRFWSDEEKRSICLQALAPGFRLRRFAMNANLIHNWLRDPWFASDEQAVALPEAGPAGHCQPEPGMWLDRNFCVDPRSDDRASC